jgi:hypothetical protein
METGLNQRMRSLMTDFREYSKKRLAILVHKMR